jgi:RNA 2',3'-cyclic 3'-phosphodiesterase
MRLFTGLDLPREISARLEELLRRLKPAAHLRWSPPGNLHITTKFIGELADDRLGEIKTALGGMAAREPVAVAIRKLGFFPNARDPRNFWCGIEAPGLAELAADTDLAMAALGVPREKRAFSAHLTLARVNERIDLEPLHQAIAQLPSLEFGNFAVEKFYLYRSKLGPGGSVYTKLAEFPLRKS